MGTRTRGLGDLGTWGLQPSRFALRLDRRPSQVPSARLIPPTESPSPRVPSCVTIHPSLFYGRMHIASLQHAIRRTEAQIVDVIGDSRPSMRHSCRDDDDVAGLYPFLDDVGADHRAAARRTVQFGGHLV